ncbi:MFS general substrate transporter [Ceratobasidium sp. AG-I]|nr:MFS general substrate transporter [Ceratobasidium sp. AG-I]
MSQAPQTERPGMFKQAAEAVKDLFRHERVTVLDEHGNYVEKIIKPEPLVNPITLVRMLTWKNWLFFIVGLAAWTVDGYDFHSVSLSITNLSKYYGVSKTDISTSITLTLLFRSLGAAIFGVAGDYYGRKWPMVINMFIIGALQLGTAYAPTYHVFLGVRSLFGIGMGGVWGCAIAMALESVPTEARGLMSGILQQGYSLGYLLAAVFNMTIAPRGGADGFKDLFYIGAGASFFVGFARMCFPESEQFLRAKEQGEKGGHTKQFMKEAGIVIKTQWRRIIYACILMALFNFFSHTTQDSYPTFLQSGKGFTQQAASRGTIIAKTGAVIGGAVIGYISQSFGRRRSIVVACILAACIIPAWVLPNSQAGLAAGSFFLQFMVQGAWGVIPVHLNELSPPAFRASFPGIAYQIGNMISSPAAEMVTGISEKTFINHMGKQVEAFGPVMGVATAIIAVLLAIWTAVGKEAKGSHFENAVAGHGVVDPGAAKPDIETGSSRAVSVNDEKNEQPVHQEKA